MVEDALDMGQLELGKFTLERAPFSLAALVSNCIARCGLYWLRKGDGLVPLAGKGPGACIGEEKEAHRTHACRPFSLLPSRFLCLL